MCLCVCTEQVSLKFNLERPHASFPHSHSTEPTGVKRLSFESHTGDIEVSSIAIGVSEESGTRC